MNTGPEPIVAYMLSPLPIQYNEQDFQTVKGTLQMTRSSGSQTWMHLPKSPGILAKNAGDKLVEMESAREVLGARGSPGEQVLHGDRVSSGEDEAAPGGGGQPGQCT